MLSQRMREVMMRPYGANNASNSLWHIDFGIPLTYKFAPLMFSLLGRANETCAKKKNKQNVKLEEKKRTFNWKGDPVESTTVTEARPKRLLVCAFTANSMSLLQ